MNSSIKSHFLNLYSIALADFEFDENEIVALYKIGEERGIPREEIDLILLNPASIKFNLPEKITEKIEYLYDYTKIIIADGKVEDSEIKTLEKFCRKLEFREENISLISELLIEAAKNNVQTNEIIKFVTQNN